MASCVGISRDPWDCIIGNLSYITNHVNLQSQVGRDFLRLLLERGILLVDDYQVLKTMSREDGADHLFIDILPRQPPRTFATFYRILSEVQLDDVARHLQRSPQTNCDASKSSTPGDSCHDSDVLLLQQENEVLKEQVVQLEGEKTRAVEERRAVTANADLAIQAAHEEKVYVSELRSNWHGEKLSSLALRCRQLECDFCRSQHLVRYRPPTMWQLWETRLPSRKPLYGEVAKIGKRLTVGGYNGQLHVLREDRSQWETFVRTHGEMFSVVAHEDGCLLQMYDKNDKKYLIQRFSLKNEDHKWQTLATLPEELQMKGVAIAVNENTLFAVGGRSGNWECVNTAYECKLETGDWFQVNGMRYRRSSCSVVFVNNTLFVGSGGTDGGELCSEVEVLRPRTGKWSLAPSSSNFHCTLSSFNNRLLATGGVTKDTFSKTDTVQLYDEAVGNWFPLPPMAQVRYRHGTCPLSNGELVVAEGGGAGPITYVIESMNL